MMKILLVLAGWVHPPYRGRVAVKEALAELAGYSFDEVGSLEEAEQGRLSDYNALVLYYHHPNVALTSQQLEAFRSYVQQGGGVLAVHSATASYKPTPEYFEILGGRFVGHGPIAPIDIRPAQSDDPIFGGIAAFTVHDELYQHRLQPDIEVHFIGDQQGTPAPVVWTRTVGNGRVCYLTLGHRSASMKDPSVTQILQRGLRWVSRGPSGTG